MGVGHSHALYVHEHSVVHRMAPQIKLAATLAFVAIVAVTPREAVWAFGIYGLLLASLVVLSRVEFAFVVVRLAGILPFVGFAFLIPFVAEGEAVRILRIELSEAGLWATWNIVAKATIGAGTSILLAATTEVPDLLAGLGRLRVPVIITSIAGFMIRYLELIVDDVRRVRIAMTSRGYRPRWIGHARPLGLAAGALFVRSYERGERVHAAMIARGFTGTMPDLRRRSASAADWATGALLPLAALAVLIAAVVTR